MLEKVVVWSERLIKLENSWFSAKPIVVGQSQKDYKGRVLCKFRKLCFLPKFK